MTVADEELPTDGNVCAKCGERCGGQGHILRVREDAPDWLRAVAEGRGLPIPFDGFWCDPSSNTAKAS